MTLASSTAISHSLLFCCIMFFSPYFSNLFVSGAKPSSTCSGSAPGYRGMVVAPRYGPCSPLGLEKSYAVFAQILLRDEQRVQSINTLALSRTHVVDAHDKKTHQLSIPSKPGAANYVVNLGFGTPTSNFPLTLDTGSDVTWIRCKPCSRCTGEPKTKIFDPKSSSTFRKLYCISNCSKTINYFDNTSATGYWASDTLTISAPDSFPNFKFVCVEDTNTSDIGILAFGKGLQSDNSLVTQTRTNVFCHCLPSDDATGYLLFGPEARERCQVENFTPLVSNPRDREKYFVHFVGISIGNNTLKITSSSPDTMIDSGTVITRLPGAVYEQFRSVFRKLMEENGLTQTPDHDEFLDTCYKPKGHKYGTVKIPAVVLHFENLDVNLDRSQVIIWKKEKSSVFCLAFKGNENVIIGNHQLQKLNVLYDIQKSKLGIGTGNCGK